MTDKEVLHHLNQIRLLNAHIGQVRKQACRLYIDIEHKLDLRSASSHLDCAYASICFVIALVDCGINTHNHITSRAQWRRQLGTISLASYLSAKAVRPQVLKKLGAPRPLMARTALLWLKCAESCATQRGGVGLAVIIQLPHGHSSKALMSMCSRHLGEVVRLSSKQWQTDITKA